MDIPDALPADQHIIYALVDPTDGLVHYVGQTNQPKRRLTNHLGTQHYRRGAKVEWVRLLDQKGQKPLMQVLERVSSKRMALVKEREWIQHFQEQGMPIVNAKRRLKLRPIRKTFTPLLEEVLVVRPTRSQPPSGSERADSRKSEKHLQREERILDAAATLLLRLGYRKIGLENVTREVGESQAAIYLHWQNIDEMLQAALWREKRCLSEDIQQRIAADPEGSLFHRLIAHGAVATLSNHLIAALVRGEPGILEGLPGTFDKETIGQYFADFNLYIAQLQQVGQIRADLPVPLITFLIGALKIGIINLPDLIGQEQIPPAEQLTDAISDMLRLWLEPAQHSIRGEEHEML
jgi:AcrR family transcriptional regulator